MDKPTLIPMDRLTVILNKINSSIKNNSSSISLPLSISNGGTGVTSESSLREKITGFSNPFAGGATSVKTSILIGDTSFHNYRTSSDFFSSILVGYKVADSASKANNSIVIGDYTATYQDLDNNIVIGNSSLTGPRYYGTSDTIIIGNSSVKKIQTSTKSVFIGNDISSSTTLSRCSVMIGNHAMPGTGTQDYCVAIGAYAGSTENESADSYSVYVGAMSGKGRKTHGDCVCIGYGAGSYNTSETSSSSVGNIMSSTIIGTNAGNTTYDCAYTTAVGQRALYNASATSTTAIGRFAGEKGTSSSSVTHDDSVLIGESCGIWVNTTQCTFVGGSSPYPRTAGSSFTNSSLLGYRCTITGNNQVQLGNSSTTTYVYGTVQNRSDLRDKTNILDIEYDYIQFIDKLRPITYQWDMREDYLPEPETDDEGQVVEPEHPITLSDIVHDGSHTRTRRHNGFIAQDVKRVMDELNFDFGGYQDHSVNGGSDVLSLGYDEFIAPIVAYIQDLRRELVDLKEQNKRLEARLNVLESKN